MTDLERFRVWVQSYEGFPSEYLIDYTSETPNTGAIFPKGLVEVSRTQDIMGNSTISNQYNFAIYNIYPKNEGDDTLATANAEWVMGFQRWVQEQSAKGLAPTFGNTDTEKETMFALNGQYVPLPDTALAQYTVLVTVNFKQTIGV